MMHVRFTSVFLGHVTTEVETFSDGRALVQWLRETSDDVVVLEIWV